MNNISATNLSRRAFLMGNATLAPTVTLTDKCLAENGVYCESCRDTCDVGALRFALQRGAVSRPIFDADLCIQCGECAQVCPQDAIRVRPREPSRG